MPWPGGCGMLVDFQGNDRYSAGDAAQGYGESHGIGALVDLRGDDVQARGYRRARDGARELGVGLCYDGGGRDEYISTGELSLGAATSLGLGLCVDDAGDDTYTLPESGLGCATGPGLALFVEGGGDDRYVVADPREAFGRAAPVCSCERGLGRTLVRRAAFFDLAGRDIYPDSWNERAPRNSGAWWGSADMDRDWRVHGLGLDRP